MTKKKNAKIGGGWRCASRVPVFLLWPNKYGTTCAGYAKEGNCAGGHVMPGKEWAMGEEYNHPEQNCCACYGK